MAEVHVLDDYYLAITLLITIAYQLLFFSIAFSLKFDKLTDFAGGTNFVVLAVLTLSFSAHHSARQILASLFLILWGARLSGFLLFRILKTGKDDRFDDKRDKFFPFLGFWVFQMLWVWTVSLPVTLLNSPNITQYPQPRFGTGCDIAGLLLWVLGITLESVSDIQKYRFRSTPSNAGRTCTTGLFAWSRHPNYFGEIALQFGIYTLALAPSAYQYIPKGSGAFAAQYASIVGPLFLTLLLLFVSGLTLQERPGAKRKFEADGPEGEGWRECEAWLEGTSILLPLPPGVWGAMPVWVKRTVGCEWPCYVFRPERDVDWKKVGERRGEEGRGGERNGEGEREGDGSDDGIREGRGGD